MQHNVQVVVLLRVRQQTLFFSCWFWCYFDSVSNLKEKLLLLITRTNFLHYIKIQFNQSAFLLRFDGENDQSSTIYHIVQFEFCILVQSLWATSQLRVWFLFCVVWRAFFSFPFTILFFFLLAIDVQIVGLRERAHTVILKFGKSHEPLI